MKTYIKIELPITITVNIGTAVTSEPVNAHDTVNPQRSVAILVFAKLLMHEIL